MAILAMKERHSHARVREGRPPRSAMAILAMKEPRRDAPRDVVGHDRSQDLPDPHPCFCGSMRARSSRELSGELPEQI